MVNLPTKYWEVIVFQRSVNNFLLNLLFEVTAEAQEAILANKKINTKWRSTHSIVELLEECTELVIETEGILIESHQSPTRYWMFVPKE